MNKATLETMNKSEYFKQLFQNRAQEIAKSHEEKITQLMDVDSGGDEVDIVQNNIIRSLTDRLSSRDRETLGKIQAALLRLEDGTFGICSECEEPIPEKRLMVLPYCETCVDCQELQEKAAKSR